MAAQETIVEEFFNGQVLVRFSASKHQYFVKCPKGYIDLIVDGEERRIEYPTRKTTFEHVISCTQYTKAALDKPKLRDWAVSVCVGEAISLAKKGLSPEEWKKKAKAKSFQLLKSGADIGNTLHAYTGDHINHILGKGEKPSKPVEKEALSCVLAWESFLRDYKDIEFLATEQVIYHPILDVAGTLDIMFRRKGQIGIIDTKTSPNIYPDFMMQLALYRDAVKLLTGKLPEIAWILQLSKDTGSYLLEDRSNHHQMDFGAFMAGHFLTNWVDSLKLTY